MPLFQTLKSIDLILASASRGLSLQVKDGSMPAGHNGPWYHADTPVRTTAHWALLFLKAFLITKDSIFREAVLKACSYLASEDALYKGCFFCRKDSHKDKTNNLVGQAWAAEALAIAGHYLKEQRFLSFAGTILEKHFFDPYFFLWYKGNFTAERETVYIGRTLNQQLLFSTVALFVGKRLKNQPLTEKARSFFEHLCLVSRFIQPGLLHHKVFLPAHLGFFNLNYYKTLLKQWLEKRRWRKISEAYLPFVLYGIALNHFLNPDELFWQKTELKEWLKQILCYILNHFPYGYLEDPASFRWAYNPVGFEVYFALEQFHGLLELDVDLEAEQRWVELQIRGYYDLDTNLMNKNSCDPVILASRFYELIWLPEMELRVTHER